MGIFSRAEVSATVADNALIVRTGGERPRLWRGSLGDAAVATLEMRESSDGKVPVHKLVLVRADGTPDEIAIFTAKADAQHAFRVVSDRLMRGVAAVSETRRPLVLRWLIGIAKVALWALFVLMLLLIVSVLVIDRPAGTTTENTPVTNTAPARAAAPAVPPAAPTGVPVPAEQLFDE